MLQVLSLNENHDSRFLPFHILANHSSAPMECMPGFSMMRAVFYRMYLKHVLLCLSCKVVNLKATDQSAAIYMISTHITKVVIPMKRLLVNTLPLRCEGCLDSMCERFCAE